MSVLHGLGHGLDEAFLMLWATLWALVLGFALSGAVQAFVSRDRMRRTLGDHGPAALTRSAFFGMISSSCSYASAALAKSLFARGADFTAAMVFMIASTNLVVELGLVLWLLLGWPFAVAEFVGGAIMIVLLGLLLPRVLPAAWTEAARIRLAAESDAAAESDDPDDSMPADGPAGRRRSGWRVAAGYTISDLTMLRGELVIGFLVAGYLGALVPMDFWSRLFLTGHGFWSSLENAVLGPVLAVLSFVCSVGNVPLAAALWHGGSSFGGVVSFVFADLITLPLLLIYRRYFGPGITLRLFATFWATMSTAGLAVEYLFRALGIHAPTRPHSIDPVRFGANYTTVLNLVALVGFAGLYRLYRSRPDQPAQRHAKDPVCGMQVERALAPARAHHDGQTFWFCCDGCRDRFVADPSRYLAPAAAQPGGPAPEGRTQLLLAGPVPARATDPPTGAAGPHPASGGRHEH